MKNKKKLKILPGEKPINESYEKETLKESLIPFETLFKKLQSETNSSFFPVPFKEIEDLMERDKKDPSFDFNTEITRLFFKYKKGIPKDYEKK